MEAVDLKSVHVEIPIHIQVDVGRIFRCLCIAAMAADTQNIGDMIGETSACVRDHSTMW